MNLVLERRILAGCQQAGIVSHRLAQCFHPGAVALRKIRQHVALHQFLDTGMTDPEPNPAVVLADMRGGRRPPVMAGDAAPDFCPPLPRRPFGLVPKSAGLARGPLAE